jgi:hypothetical protein
MLLLLGACADFAISANDKADVYDEATTDDTENDTGEQLENSRPRYWSLGGQWSIESGQIISETSSLSLSFWLNDTDYCFYTMKISGVDDAYETRPDETLHSWWSLNLEYPTVPESDCDWSLTEIGAGDDLQASLNVGFGPYDDRLSGALGANGTDPENSSTFGLYLTNPTDPEQLLIFGVAGTAEQYNSSDVSDTDVVVKDGVYVLTALYLFPY